MSREIDREYLRKRTEYIEAHRRNFFRKNGALKDSTPIKTLLRSYFPEEYLSESNAEAAKKRGRRVLMYFCSKQMSGSEKKEFVAVLNFIASLANDATPTYGGKDKKIKIYLEDNVGGEIFMTDQQTHDYISGVENVQKYIKENIEVMRVLLKKAKEDGPQSDVGKLEKCIDLYQEEYDKLEKLKEAPIENREDIITRLKMIKKLAMENRENIIDGLMEIDSDPFDPMSVFYKINDIFDEINKINNVGKKVRGSVELIGYTKNDAFNGLVNFYAKRKTFMEIKEKIDYIVKVQSDNTATLDREIALSQAKISELKEKGRHIYFRLDNGEISESEADYEVSNLNVELENEEINLQRMQERKFELGGMAVGLKGIWQGVATELVTFVRTCSASEFLDYADDLIEALRSVLTFVNGQRATAGNGDVLQTANDCITYINAVLSEKNQQIAQHRQELAEMRRKQSERIRGSMAQGQSQGQTRAQGAAQTSRGKFFDQPNPNREAFRTESETSSSRASFNHNGGSIND